MPTDYFEGVNCVVSSGAARFFNISGQTDTRTTEVSWLITRHDDQAQHETAIQPVWLSEIIPLELHRLPDTQRITLSPLGGVLLWLDYDVPLLGRSFAERTDAEVPVVDLGLVTFGERQVYMEVRPDTPGLFVIQPR